MKRIISIFLCILLCLGAVGCGRKNENLLTVALSSLNTDFYPFTKAGDGEIKNMLFTRLIDFDESGVPFCKAESSAVSEDLRIFYADAELGETEDFVEGGYTAFEFSLKKSVTFSDGAPLTAEDVMFSIYCALDPKAGYIGSDVLPVAGFDNYIHQSVDASELISLASEILSKGKDYSPTEEDSFSAEESEIYWNAFNSAGEVFVSNIVSYVTDIYCTDELVSSYIFDGYTGDAVKGSTALTNTYAMRLWNYGNYTYSYVPDENGIFVGVGDENGVYSFKTTLEKALESEDYVQYVADENGLYVYDRVSAKYVPFEEGATGKRYSRVLSDKYTVLSKSALTGFRDMAGTLYTLEGDDYPSLSDFFSLMCVSYTENGVIDYPRMESVEAATEGDGFAKEAANAFAAALAGEHSVDGIEGIKLEASSENETVTIYIEGNNWDRIYHMAFPIVSKAHYTKGYTAAEGAPSAFGVPLSDEGFFEHLKQRSAEPLGAGPYKLREVSEDFSFVLLQANEKFRMGGESVSFGYGEVKLIATDKTATEAISELGADISLIPLEDGSTVPENVKTYFVPGLSYDYAVVNPAVYININVRRALLSLMDTALAAGGEERRITSSMPSFMWASVGAENSSLYDETTETAASFFEAAGYTVGDEGELIDPATKQRAHFKLSLLPSAKGSGAEAMFLKTAELLEALGASAEIVYDSELLMSIYSDAGVGIYSLGWETEAGGSLYMRYALCSRSDAVKANGILALSEGGQIDNFGMITFSDGEGATIEYNQASAVSALEALILQGDSEIDVEAKKTSYSKALSLISALSFELPLCQRGYTYCVNSQTVDLSTINENATVFASLIAEPWRISPASVEE